MIQKEDYTRAMKALKYMIKKANSEKQKALELNDYSRANNQDYYSAGLSQALSIFEIINDEDNVE